MKQSFMFSHAQDAPLPPPPSERSEGWLQALLFLVLMAGAGAFAVMATRVELPPPDAFELEPRNPGSHQEVAVRPAPGPTRLLVFVDSPERAAMLRAWRESQPLMVEGSFVAVDLSGPIAAAALEEAILFANVACAQAGCDTVSILDLSASAEQ
jgi:hypothetical protein